MSPLPKRHRGSTDLPMTATEKKSVGVDYGPDRHLKRVINHALSRVLQVLHGTPAGAVSCPETSKDIPEGCQPEKVDPPRPCGEEEEALENDRNCSEVPETVSKRLFKGVTAFVLETPALLTVEALLASATIKSHEILIANPSGSVPKDISTLNPELRLHRGTSHSLLGSVCVANGGVKNQLKFCFLDYNGSFGREGYRVGIKRRRDIRSLFENMCFCDGGAVLAVTFGQRGISETYPDEHISSAYEYILRVSCTAGVRCDLVGAHKYSHGPKSAPMALLVFLVNRPLELPLSMASSVFSEALSTHAEAADAGIMQAVVLGGVTHRLPQKLTRGEIVAEFLADLFLDHFTHVDDGRDSPQRETVKRQEASSSSHSPRSLLGDEGSSDLPHVYISAMKNPLGKLGAGVFAERGWAVQNFDSGMSRPRFWAPRSNLGTHDCQKHTCEADMLDVVWMCEEAPLKWRSGAKEPAMVAEMRQLVTLLNRGHRPQLLAVHAAYAENVSEKWEGEDWDRLLYVVMSQAGASSQPLFLGTYQSPTSKAFLLVVGFRQRRMPEARLRSLFCGLCERAGVTRVDLQRRRQQGSIRPCLLDRTLGPCLARLVEGVQLCSGISSVLIADAPSLAVCSHLSARTLCVLEYEEEVGVLESCLTPAEGNAKESEEKEEEHEERPVSGQRIVIEKGSVDFSSCGAKETDKVQVLGHCLGRIARRDAWLPNVPAVRVSRYPGCHSSVVGPGVNICGLLLDCGFDKAKGKEQVRAFLELRGGGEASLVGVAELRRVLPVVYAVFASDSGVSPSCRDVMFEAMRSSFEPLRCKSIVRSLQ